MSRHASTGVVNSSAQSADRDAVAAVAGAFESAWNQHDMKALAALFAPDADFVNVVGMWWKNQEEIEAAHVHSHSTFLRNSVLSGNVENVKFLRRDVAVAHVLWELKGQVEPDGSVGQPRHGIMLFVMACHSGRWLIQTAQNTDIIAGVLTRAAETA
ncbi:MAG TPA: SgcJ/EcaC family oxidoreductase [Stellaceae bacterium]|nr:SgcJ/EcaC family oxidoreductase [Stellaceae bacterium]